MKQRIIDHWITTAIGVGICIFAGVLVWKKAITIAEASPLWILGAGLFAAKDTLITGTK